MSAKRPSTALMLRTDDRASTLFRALGGAAFGAPGMWSGRFAPGTWCKAACLVQGHLEREAAARGRAAGEVHEAAYHDPLTRLPNRALFLERLENAIRAMNQKCGPMIALVFFDLDRFMTVNDTLGHVAGDRLLKALVGRIRCCLRPGDVFARIGGDEFAMVAKLDASDSARGPVRLSAVRRSAERSEARSLLGARAPTKVRVGLAGVPRRWHTELR
jgi:diguanylate cyclase (GGDEF)-like protein